MAAELDTTAIDALIAEVDKFVESSQSTIKAANQKTDTNTQTAVVPAKTTKPVAAASIVPTAILENKPVMIGLATAGTLVAGYGIYKAVKSKKKK